MAKNTARTGTAPFAHLLALVTGGSKNAKRGAAAEDEREDEEEASEEEEETGAEEESDEERAETEDEEKPEGKRARRAKKAETDEDDEAEGKAEDDDDDEEMAQARREGFAAAQARGRRIFGSASAALRPDMAAHFAFNDTMSSNRAIAMLDMAAGGVSPAPEAGSRLHRRMSRVTLPNPGVGGGSGAKKGSEVDDFVAMAAKAAEKAGIR